MPKKVTEKPFNSGTMTNAAFFGMIRSALRQRTRWWKPLAAAKLKARRAYKGANKRLKWEFKCAECKLYFPDSNVVVDHIIPAGTLTKFEDLPAFAKKLFCEIEGFQILCKPCHKLKTAEEAKTKINAKN